MTYKTKEINPFLRLGTTSAIISTLLISWIFIAKVDVIANTNGKIITESKNQTISILETSSLDKILVKEGDIVHKNQIVAILDNAVQFSIQKQNNNELNYYYLRSRAIDSLLNNSSFTKNSDDESSQFSQISAEFSSKKLTFDNTVLQAQAEILQAQTELQANSLNLSKLKGGKEFWINQISSYEKMKESGFIAKLSADEKIREAKEKIEEIKVQESVVSTNQAKISQLLMKQKTIKSDFTQQLLKEKTEVLQKIKSFEEELNKSNYNLNSKTLLSPVDGYVKEISTNSHKSVITQGNTLMTIVPKDEKLKAEIFVKNSDIGYIELEQPVNIKVETFAFQKYGLLHGKVAKISPDSTEDKETRQNLYRIEVIFDKDYLEKDNKKYYIKPGMIVNADVILSKRTIFEYLTSPLQKTILESAREK